MRVILELFRIILLFTLLGTFLGYIPHTIYSYFHINLEKYEWTAMLGIYVILFVLYRNKWQFYGWYTGMGRKKLSKRITQVLITISIILILLPSFLNFLFN